MPHLQRWWKQVTCNTVQGARYLHLGGLWQLQLAAHPNHPYFAEDLAGVQAGLAFPHCCSASWQSLQSDPLLSHQVTAGWHVCLSA